AHLGGPDVEVEPTLKQFQDALAWVLHSTLSPPITSHRIVIVVVQLNMHTQLTRTCRKYRYMDSNLTQRRQGLEEKIPDIKKTLTMVEYLQERRVSLGLPIAHFRSYLPISSSFL